MPQAEAGNTICTGTLSGVVASNVRVPAGATCNLSNNVVIQGNVHVDGSLFSPGNSIDTITGNLKGEGPGTISLSRISIGGNVDTDGKRIFVFFSTIGGHLDVKNTFGVNIFRNTINGNVQFKDNTDPPNVFSTLNINTNIIGGKVDIKDNVLSVLVSGNNIDGNVQVKENTKGAHRVLSNTIDGNLQVQDNTGVFTTIDSNTVSGNAHCKDNVNQGGSPNTIAGKNKGCP